MHPALIVILKRTSKIAKTATLGSVFILCVIIEHLYSCAYSLIKPPPTTPFQMLWVGAAADIFCTFLKITIWQADPLYTVIDQVYRGEKVDRVFMCAPLSPFVPFITLRLQRNPEPERSGRQSWGLTRSSEAIQNSYETCWITACMNCMVQSAPCTQGPYAPTNLHKHIRQTKLRATCRLNSLPHLDLTFPENHHL